jgi:toxin ParE1/3/4
MDNWIVEFHPEALKEVEAARDWYAERSLVASRVFVSELIHSVEKVIENPEMWPLYQKGIHRYIFQRFPFSLIYRIHHEKIQIIAVAHAKRRPGYWKDR